MRYVSDKSISFSIRVKGRGDGVRVSFITQSSGGSTFMTDNKALIKALEQSSMYGTVYRRAPECVNVEAKKEKATKKVEEEKVLQVTEVNSWQDAVEYLIEKFGSEANKLTTPDSILNEAQAKGLKFPNLK